MTINYAYPATNFITGVHYRLNLEPDDPIFTEYGCYPYYFTANDSWVSVCYPENGTQFEQLKYIPATPSLLEGDVSPTWANWGSDRDFDFQVTYYDPADVAPAYVRLAIYDAEGTSFTTNTMTKQDPDDNDYSDGVIYEYSHPEGAGKLNQPGDHDY